MAGSILQEIPTLNTCPGDCTSCRHSLPDGQCVLDLAANGPLSTRQVAGILGISRTRVWQIEQRALQKARRVIRRTAASIVDIAL